MGIGEFGSNLSPATGWQAKPVHDSVKGALCNGGQETQRDVTRFHLFPILAKLAFLSGLGFSPGEMVQTLPAMWETGV